MLRSLWNRCITRYRNSYLGHYRGALSPENYLSPDAVVWAYRLFLDREPETRQAVVEKLNRLKTTREIRREFVTSEEFKRSNPSFPSVSLLGTEPQMCIEGVADLEELFLHIQKVWEYLGDTEPYWSVATAENFRVARINETRAEFYQSGLANVATLFDTLERNGVDHSGFKRCLEYGCGLGRVTCWLAKRFETVVAYDLSRSHLRIADEYFREVGIKNISLRHISKPQDIGNFPKVDVIYSIIVLQHNPPPIIRLIIQEIIRALDTGGVAVFQLPTYRVGYKFSLREYLESEGKGKDMEMHVLSQNQVFEIIDKEQGKILEVLEDGWTGLREGERSNTFVVQKA